MVDSNLGNFVREIHLPRSLENSDAPCPFVLMSKVTSVSSKVHVDVTETFAISTFISLEAL